MLEFLNKPYPFSFQPLRRTKQILPIGVCVFMFLILFKPFGLSTNPDYFQLSAYFTFSGAVIGLLTTVFTPYLFPRFFNESKWTLKRNLVWITWDFFCFATLMFVANHIISIYKYDNYGNFTFNRYLWFVYINLIFGLPLGIIINILNQYYLLKKHLKIAAGINDTIETSTNEDTNNQHAAGTILEFAVNKYKKVQIEVDNIIYVEALGNYLNIVYECNGIKKVTIRETINRFAQKAGPSGTVYRPHRSYLVNLHYIDNVTGDAQGLKIHFKDMDTAIPVSRNKIKEFRLLTSKKM
jgi:hypothetical protein